MAGQVSKKELDVVLMQGMLAAKNIRPQRDRLVHLRRQQKQLSPGDDHADRIRELGMDLFDVYYIGIEAGAMSVIPDEQLYNVLLAQRFPPRPTTQTEAFSLVEATFNAVKLLQEHHVPRCIELLIGERPPNVTGEPPRVRGMLGYLDDPVAAGMEHLAMNGLPNPAAATARTAPQASSSIDVDHALTYLYRACSLASLAVRHIDLAVVVLSSFLDPKDAASLSEFTNQHKYISEKGPYPSAYQSDSD